MEDSDEFNTSCQAFRIVLRDRPLHLVGVHLRVLHDDGYVVADHLRTGHVQHVQACRYGYKQWHE